MAWREPAWFTRPALRFAFQRGIEACGPTARIVRPPRRYPGGFALAVHLDLPDIPEQTVTIVFGQYSPHTPHIYSDRPSESPHRYAEGALCIWYPYDPAEQQWTRRKEEWWRLTGEWPGQEAPHHTPEPQS